MLTVRGGGIVLACSYLRTVKAVFWVHSSLLQNCLILRSNSYNQMPTYSNVMTQDIQKKLVNNWITPDSVKAQFLNFLRGTVAPHSTLTYILVWRQSCSFLAWSDLALSVGPSGIVSKTWVLVNSQTWISLTSECVCLCGGGTVCLWVLLRRGLQSKQSCCLHR